MLDKNIMRLLKCLMTTGILLIILGIYFHFYNGTIEEMGIKGIIISAGFLAVGMIISIPSKMLITFLLVNREIEQDLKKKRNK